jgi:hypothetical protein
MSIAFDLTNVLGKKRVDPEKRRQIALELELVVIANNAQDNELKIAPEIADSLNHPNITVGCFDSQIRYKTTYHKHTGEAVTELKHLVSLTDEYVQKINASMVAHPISRFPPRVENLGAEFIKTELNTLSIPSMFTSSLTMCFTCSTRVEQIKVGLALGNVIRHNGTHRTNSIETTLKHIWKQEYVDRNPRQYSWIIGRANGVVVDRWHDATRDWDAVLSKAGEFYSSAIKVSRM